MEELSNSQELDPKKIEEFNRIFAVESYGKPMVVAFSGSITDRKAADEVPYRTPSYNSPDNNNLASGGKARVIAVAETSKYFPDATILTNSRDMPDAPGDRPSHATVAKYELSNLYGVDEEQIKMEEDSITTVSGLVGAMHFALQNGEKNVCVVTNRYHITRMRAMIQNLPSLVHQDDEGGYRAYKEV